MVILSFGKTIIDDDAAVKLYISQFGNDDNDGLTENTPVKTITKVKSIISTLTSTNIHILFKQNETWTDSFGIFTFSGLNEDCPLVISSYPADVLGGVNPKFITGKNIAFSLTGLSNVIIKDIDIVTGTPIPLDNAIYGIFIDNCKNILIENCKILGYKININVNNSENIFIRKNIVSKSHDTSVKASYGIQIINTINCLIDNNVLDHNGWDEDLLITKSSISHGITINENCKSISIIENMILKSSSCGIIFRCGGVCEKNIFVENPTALIYGMSSTIPAAGGTISNNIVMESNDISDSLIKGNGFAIGNVAEQLTITENLIANTKSAKDWGSGIDFNYTIGNGIQNLIFQNNIIYKNSTPVLITISDSFKSGTMKFEGNNLQAINTVSPAIIVKTLLDSLTIDKLSELLVLTGNNNFIGNNLYSDKGVNILKFMNQVTKLYRFITFEQYRLLVSDLYAINKAIQPVVTTSILDGTILELVNLNRTNNSLQSITKVYSLIHLFTGEPYIPEIPSTPVTGTIPEDMILRFNFEIDMIKKYCDSLNNNVIVDENLKAVALSYFNTCINQIENMKIQMMAMLELINNKNVVTVSPFMDSINTLDKK